MDADTQENSNTGGCLMCIKKYKRETKWRYKKHAEKTS